MVRMSRRRFVGRTAAVLGSLLAAACDLRPLGTSEGETPSAAPAVPPRLPEGVPERANPPRTVQVLTRASWREEHSEVLSPLAEEFSSRHPPLTVDWQPLPLTSDYGSPSRGQQIEELHSAGVLFDVMQLSLGLVTHLFIGDAAVDLLPFVRSDKYDLADYWPGTMEAMQWQRQLYGLHTEVLPTVLYCNEALFAQADLGVPTTAWTWPQLLAAAKQLTDHQQPKPIFGFALNVQALSTETLPLTLPWIWANGGAMLNADRSESLVDRPATQETLQWLADLALTHEVAPRAADLRKADALDAWDLFVDGREAMLYGLWVSEMARNQALGSTQRFSIAMAEPPRGPRQSASFLHQGLGAYHLSKAARVPDDAWRFLRWWTSEATQRQFQAANRNGFVSPPARRSLAEEFVDRYGTATLAALAYARPLPVHPKWWELARAYDRGLVPVWKGEQSVVEATAAIARDQNAILAEWRQQQQGTP